MSGEAATGVRTLGLLWRRFTWRHWREEWKMTCLLVGILSLGVAVFLSIHLANKAAVTGFDLFTESISGESDLLVRSKTGVMDDEVPRQVRAITGDLPVGIFPVLELTAAEPETRKEKLLQMVGVDLVSLQNAIFFAPEDKRPQPEAETEEDGPDANTLGRPDLCYVSSRFATKRGVGKGGSITVLVNDQLVEMEIMGVLPDNPLSVQVPENLILLDLPGLQELAGREGEISRVEIRVAPGANYQANLDEAIDRLKRNAYDDWIVETPRTRKESVTTMSAGFRLNLTILSGLALLVGIYLIMQAMEAAVVKRRSEIAILRSLGVTPAEIRAAWMVESVILGMAGSALGILLGRALAETLVGAIATTVNTLYYQTTNSAIFLTPVEIILAFAVGVVACVIAAFIPAREASRTPPSLAIRSGTQGGGLAILRQTPLGVGVLLAGLLLTLVPPIRFPDGFTVPLGGYVAALLVVAGTSMVLGVAFRPLSRLLRVRDSDGLRGYAASQFRRPMGRHRLTAAGLAVAIGMSAAMAILVSSFENTLTGWINQLLKADVYISTAGSDSIANVGTISSETWQAIRDREDVAGVDVLRRYDITLDGNEVLLGGSEYNPDTERYLQMMWLSRPEHTGPSALNEMVGEEFPVWVNEGFHRITGLGQGDSLELPTPAGAKTVVIDGVYADYATEKGAILAGRKFTSTWYGDEDVSQMAVYAREGVDHEELVAQIQDSFPSLTTRTNAHLREESLNIFHQTFSVTYALEAIAVFIAVTGLGLALAGLLLERVPELMTLKSLGAGRYEIARAVAWEGVGLALVGVIAGILLSFGLGWILIFVINPQCFGWTLQYSVPWISLVALGIATVLVAAVVAWVVGYRNAKIRSDVLQEE